MQTLDSMGTVVTFDAPAEVSFSIFRQAIIDEGFDAKYAREMLPRNAFQRAARELSEQRIIRKVEETEDGEIQFQFTKEWLESGEFHYERECDLFLDKETGSVRSENTQLAGEAQRLLLEHQAKRNASDITRLIQKLFDDRKGDLVSLRKTGGIYFVPDTHKDLVDSVYRLMARIGGTLNRYVIRFGDVNTNQSVAQAMTDHLHDLIDQFKLTCKDITSETSLTVIERRANVIAELRDKLQAYQALLSGYSDSIAAEIDKAENDLVAAIVNNQEMAVA